MKNKRIISLLLLCLMALLLLSSCYSDADPWADGATSTPITVTQVPSDNNDPLPEVTNVPDWDSEPGLNG